MGLLDAWLTAQNELPKANIGEYDPSRAQVLIDKLGQTWPAKMGQALWSAAMLPGDVYAGRAQVPTTGNIGGQYSDENIGRATDLSGMVMGGAMPAAEKGAVGIFGGRLARTADHAKLSEAESMAKAGATSSEIWDRTGWFQGGDNKWRFEIPDIGMTVRPGQGRGVGPDSPVYHPGAADAYPQLGEISNNISRRPLDLNWQGYTDGNYNPNTKQLTVGWPTEAGRKRTAGHELSHVIDDIEGFSPGTTPAGVASRHPGMSGADAYDQYFRNVGEVNARNFETRLNMTEAERRLTPPVATEDVARADQIAGVTGGDSASIRAYHGSPYDFDRFDISKIGTGEGNAVYGHGIYTAESPRVAEQYKTGLSYDSYDPYSIASYKLHDNSNNAGRAVRDLRQVLEEADGMRTGEIEAVKEAIYLIENDLPSIGKPNFGKMYEVNINAHPDQFMDWHGTMAEQSPQVQAGLRNILGDRAFDRYAREGLGGYDAYHDIAGATLKKYNDPTLARPVMLDQGIQGTKYFDQQSRGPQEGTRNFVVFNDAIIDILKKYGMAGLGVIPAAGQLPIPPSQAPSFAGQ